MHTQYEITSFNISEMKPKVWTHMPTSTDYR